MVDDMRVTRTTSLVSAVLGAAGRGFTAAEIVRIADRRPDVIEIAIAMHDGKAGVETALTEALGLVG